MMRGAGVRRRRRQAAPLAERSWGGGTLVLHRQLLLYQVGQGFASDVKRIKAQVIILLFAG